MSGLNHEGGAKSEETSRNLGEQIKGRLAVRQAAAEEVEAAQSTVDAAQARLRHVESLIDPRSEYVCTPKPDAEPLIAGYYIHRFWHDDEGSPELERTVEITNTNPFFAGKSVKVDFKRGCVVMESYGDRGDNYCDWSFSQAGRSSWYLLEVPFDRLDDVELTQLEPDTSPDHLLLKAVRGIPGM